MKKLYNRCMGDCCEDIGLRVSPKELEAAYVEWVSREQTRSGGTHDVSMAEQGGDIAKTYRDIHLLFPMLVFFKKDRNHPEVPDTDHAVYHYTCKHYDKKNNKCTIYKHRPEMCSSYPNKDFCLNPKCKWKKMVKGREAAKKALALVKVKVEKNKTGLTEEKK